jgi:hypothetical protein
MMFKSILSVALSLIASSAFAGLPNSPQLAILTEVRCELQSTQLEHVLGDFTLQISSADDLRMDYGQGPVSLTRVRKGEYVIPGLGRDADFEYRLVAVQAGTEYNFIQYNLAKGEEHASVTALCK